MVDQYINPILFQVTSRDNWLLMDTTVAVKNIDDSIARVYARKLKGVTDLLSCLHTAKKGRRDHARDVLSI